MAAFERVVNLDVSGSTKLLVEKQCKAVKEAHARLLRLKAEAAADSVGFLYRNLAALDVPPHDIKITLIETPPENWGLRGGMPASEIDLGFKIDV